MLLLSRNAANSIDAYLIQQIGIPRDILIEHASVAVSKCCIEYLEKRKSQCVHCAIHIFAGKGMNGQDAFACARNLYAAGYKVNIWEVLPFRNDTNQNCKLQGSEIHKTIQNTITSSALSKASEDSKPFWHRNSCVKLGIPIRPANEYQVEENSLIVDGIFGTSFTLNREFTLPLKEVFDKINSNHGHKGYIISIDLPSGVDADTGDACSYAITADETVTFFAPKIGIISYPGRKYAGAITIDAVGIPTPLIDSIVADQLPIMLEFKMVSRLVPSRPKDGHKGTFGRVGIIGGSKGMAGSVCLSAMAAMRSGAGLTFMRVPGQIIADCLAVVPEVLISDEYILATQGTDAVLIGPGLDDSEESANVLWSSISTVQNLILDAEALNIMSNNEEKTKLYFELRKRNGLPWVILTPHPGEFTRLAPDLSLLNRIDAAREAARRFGAILVLKGAGTVIADPQGNVYINTTGNSGMAKGGSGDVLSGMIVTFLAQGMKPIDASALAVFLHGLCGDLVVLETDEKFAIPSDFINKIPEALHILLQKGEYHTCKIPC